MCSTPAARAEVLRRWDAGTLDFPSAHHTVRTDAEGWFEVPLEARGLVLIECADMNVLHAPSGFDQSFTDPTIELRPEPMVESSGKTLVIDPWTRRVELVDGGLISAHAWATTLEGAPRTKAPSDWSFSDGLGGMGSMFGGPGLEPPAPPANAVTLTVRADPREGLVRRELSLQLGAADGGLSGWIDTRSNTHEFLVEPGRYTAQVRMPGAQPVELGVDASTPTEVRLVLEPAVGASGLVVDSTGHPVDGASVEADGVVVTKTDAQGQFSLATASQRLRAWHPGVGASETISPTTTAPVKLTLAARSQARVKVEAPDGGSVWGVARVLASPEDGAPFETVPIRNSELSLAGLQPGPHQLLLLTRDWQASHLTVEITEAPQRLVQRLVEKPAIEGLVVRGKTPVAGARVQLTRPDAIWGYLEDETITDSSGHFRLARSLPGTAQLRIDGVTVKVSIPSQRVRIDLLRK